MITWWHGNGFCILALCVPLVHSPHPMRKFDVFIYVSMSKLWRKSRVSGDSIRHGPHVASLSWSEMVFTSAWNLFSANFLFSTFICDWQWERCIGIFMNRILLFVSNTSQIRLTKLKYKYTCRYIVLLYTNTSLTFIQIQIQMPCIKQEYKESTTYLANWIYFGLVKKMLLYKEARFCFTIVKHFHI